MAIFKQRDIEEMMPPEVRQRAHDGIGKGKVDWYAGRRNVPQLKQSTQVHNDSYEEDLRNLREKRQEIKRESSEAARAQLSKAVESVIAQPRRLLEFAMQRLARVGRARTPQI